MNPEMDDNALYEDESEDSNEDRETKSTNSKSGKGSRASPRSEEEEYPEEEESVTDPSFPAHLSIVIEKVKHHFSYSLPLERLAAHMFWIKITAQRWRLKDFRPCTRRNGYPSERNLSPYPPTTQVKIRRE